MDIEKENRSIGRREEDFFIRKQNERYSQLCEIGKTVTAEMEMELLFPLVMKQTNAIMGTERSSVFLYDKNTDELWSLVATGMQDSEIRIPTNQGIAGWVFQNQVPLVINDAYNDPRFNVSIDCKSGFKTKNILCVPLMNTNSDCIGVLQALNSRSDTFTEADQTFLSAISDYVAIALDNAKLYDDVKKYSQSLQEQIVINESLVKLKNQLTKFVPQSVANLAEQDPDKLSEGKTPMDVTVLFVDFQNFSGITEKHDQRMVNHMVENHFSSYLKCIHAHNGDLNETSGDGIMVIFKDDTLENSSFRAVSTALDIVKENSRINDEFNYPWGDINLHIGISSGQAYVGTTRMKSSIGERWTYTASGLVTVIAARIGALSDNSRVYIDKKSYDMLKQTVSCELVGTFALKNISEKVTIYQAKKIELNYQ